MNCVISVIIPIYNMEPYLRQCIDSVAGQTFKNFEVILVDDGSTDNSGKICDEYAVKDSRIHVLHKENQGLSSAWNDGIRLSKGKWIVFVDSDDWIDRTYFETMLKDPRSEKADLIIASGFIREKENQQIVETSFKAPFFLKKGEERDFLKIKALNVSEKTKDQRNQQGLMSTWNKFYKASFLKQGAFLFDSKIRAGLPNDAIFNFEVFDKADIVIGMPCVCYHYRIRGNSGTRKYDSNILEQSYYVVEQLYKCFGRQNRSAAVENALSVFTFKLFVTGLNKGIFHPMNKESGSRQIKKLNKVKKYPYYLSAIYTKNNYYLSKGQTILKFALKLPWGFPIKLLCCMRQ